MKTGSSAPAFFRLLISALLCVGCSPQPQSAGLPNGSGSNSDISRTEGSSSNPSLPEGPGDTIRLVHRLRGSRHYTSLAQFLQAGSRDSVIRFLAVADEVIDASRRIHAEADRRFHAPLPPYWRLGNVENNLGPFSTDVTIIREQVDGDAASVTIREGDHLPLLHLPLVRQDGRWVYQAEACDGVTIGELRRLAQMLREVADSISLGAPFASLSDTFLYRISPQIARTQSTAVAASPSDGF